MGDFLTIRVDKALRDNFDAFCKSKGLRTSRIIKLFAFYCVKYGNIPYDFAVSDRCDDGLTDPVRVSYRMTDNLRQSFSEVCDKYGLPMSVLIRDFMNHCIANGRLPFVVGK